jgi:glucosyl-3-phosphoglycerate phosphatase
MRPDLVVASDSTRAASTAAALSLNVVPEPRLREIHLGAWQGLTGGEAEVAFPAEFSAWVAGQDVRRGNGETYAEVGARAHAALHGALRSVPAGGLLVAVTHGGTSRAVIGCYLDLPADSWWRLGPLGNCRWSVLTETTRGWRLAEHNAGEPLPADRGDDR